MPIIKHIIVVAIGIICAIYIFNPGAGIIELIPDNFPVIGNLDEAAATALLVVVFASYGLDLTALFKPKGGKAITQIQK